MENALVGAAAALLGGGPRGVPSVVGNVTTGGTESLLLAVKAARDAHPEVADPTVVVPSTAHAAFAKAAAYLRVRLVPVPVSPRRCARTRPTSRRRSPPTRCWSACSAPSYAHGVVDPVAEIASAAATRGSPLPRGRLLRRLDAALPAPARRVGAAVRLLRARRHVDLGRPAQVRVRAEGHVDPAAP